MTTLYFSFIPRFDPRDCEPLGYVNSPILIFDLDKKLIKSLTYKPNIGDKIIGKRSAYIYPKAVYRKELYRGTFYFVYDLVKRHFRDWSLNTTICPIWTQKINNIIYIFHLPPPFIDYFTYKYISTEFITYISELPKDIRLLIAKYFPAPKYRADLFMYYI